VIDHIPDGNISLIRFIRSDRKLDIFGEKFEVSKDLVYSVFTSNNRDGNPCVAGVSW
jgi:hypothetical protein